MIKISAVFVSSVLLCGLAAGFASADRLILIPEGTTLGTGGLKAEYVKRADNDSTAVWASVGVSRIELEGSWFKGFGAGDLNAVSAQVAVLPETSFTPAVALGMRDMGNNTDNSHGFYDGSALYIAASKGVAIGTPALSDLKVHIGAGTGSLRGVFFGAETTVGGKLQIAAEYDTDKFNFSAAYPVAPMFKLKALSVRGDFYYGAQFSLAL